MQAATWFKFSEAELNIFIKKFTEEEDKERMKIKDKWVICDEVENKDDVIIWPFKNLGDNVIIWPFKYLVHDVIIWPFKYLGDDVIIWPFKYLGDDVIVWPFKNLGDDCVCNLKCGFFWPTYQNKSLWRLVAWNRKSFKISGNKSLNHKRLISAPI